MSNSKREPIRKIPFIYYLSIQDKTRWLTIVGINIAPNTTRFVLLNNIMRTYSFCALVNAFRYRALMMTNATMNNNSSLYSTWYRLPRHRNSSLVNPALLDDDTFDW